MVRVAILVPVLNRPERAAPVAESARAAATVATTVMFVCSPGDTREIRAARRTEETVVVVGWAPGRGDYARKINHAARLALADGAAWVFTGADDLAFHHGWDTTAIAAARGRPAWVGTVDLCNPRTRRARHSTHSLVAADYIIERGTVDRRGAIYHEGYHHNFVDDEGCATARARGLYVPSAAVVEHLHPDGRRAPDDDTYRLGRTHFLEDRALFRRRQNLWAKPLVPDVRRRPRGALR